MHFYKSLLSFTDGAFYNKNDKKTSYKKAVDLFTIIRQMFINNHKSMISMHPPNFIIQIKEHQWIKLLLVVHLVTLLDQF